MSVLCIPVMLLCKPIILYYQHRKKSSLGVRLNDSDSLNSSHLSVNGDDLKISNGHSSNVILLEEDSEEKVKKIFCFLFIVKRNTSCIFKFKMFCHLIRLWGIYDKLHI